MGVWLGFVLLVSLWVTAAFFYDVRIEWLRFPLVGLFVGLSGVIFGRWKLGVKGTLLWLAMVCGVLGWWFSLKPTNENHWQADVARLPWIAMNDNEVTIHNVRDFDYRTETDYVQRWDTSTVSLARIRGVDLFVTHWGAPLIAHMIVSFRFGTDRGPDKFVAMSIEARKTEGQEYSAIRGFFRQYGLIYLVADERDVVRVRTNYRQGEVVRLYHTNMKPEDARRLFLQYLRWIKYQREHPSWYNALTDNCSSSVAWYLSANRIGGLKWWDARMWLNGMAEQMLYDEGDLETDGLPFEELSKRAVINDVAKKADQDPEFSLRIRQALPH